MSSWLRWLALLGVAHMLVAGLLPVVTDEAYHWNFARHLDWGYYDHPPMIAWVIAVGRALFGDTPLGVRFVPAVLATGMAAVLALHAGGGKAARWVVLLCFAQPVIFWVGASGTPDAPLLFFWALAMACAWQAIKGNRFRWWAAAGVALGGAMLSKYTAVLIVPSVLGYLLFSREHRRVLATPGPYFALLLAALAFAPVVYWNATHDWVSLRFQVTRRLRGTPGLVPGKAAEFVLVQIAGYLPLLAPLAYAWVRGALRRTDGERFLLWCAAPTLVLFFALSFARGVPGNWTAPAYIALTVGMACTVARGEGRVATAYAKRGQRLLRIMAVSYAVGVAVAAVSVRRLQPDLFAWTDVCREVRRQRVGMSEGTFCLGLGRNFVAASQLAFHLAPERAVYGQNLIGRPGMQYDYWVDPAALVGRDAVVVMEERDHDGGRWKEVAAHFRSVASPVEVRVPVPLRDDLRFYVARAHHYLPP